MDVWIPATRLAFDDFDNSDWEEDLDNFMTNAGEVRPWTRGSHGKFYVTPDMHFESWATNAAGEPHHDDVGSERGIRRQAFKGDIAPSGAWWVTDVLDPSVDVDQAVQQVAPQAARAGLQPIYREYAAKVAVKLDLCSTCMKSYEQCECHGGAQWPEDPAADPVRDLKSPVQARVVPAWT